MHKVPLSKPLGKILEKGDGMHPCKFKRTDHSYLKMIPWKCVFFLGMPSLWNHPLQISHLQPFFSEVGDTPHLQLARTKSFGSFQLLLILIGYKAWSCTPPTYQVPWFFKTGFFRPRFLLSTAYLPYISRKPHEIKFARDQGYVGSTPGSGIPI